MRRGQNFVELPLTGRGGTRAEGAQLAVGKAVKSRAGGSDRPVDRPRAGRPPSLVSYCLNRRENGVGEWQQFRNLGVGIVKEGGWRGFGVLLVRSCGSGAIFKDRSGGLQRGRREVEMSAGPAGRRGQKLTGVVGDGAGQAEPEELPEGNGGANGMGAAVEVAKAVEALDGQGQGGDQPAEQ